MTRLTAKEGEKLLTHGSPIELGRMADAIRAERFGNTTTFIIDRNINYTNVCVNGCRFCAFYRKASDPDAYLLDNAAILEKVRETVEAGGTQVMIQGGLQPGHTALGGKKTSSWDYMRTLALTRLYMDNIPHIQGSWVTQGERIGELSLGFGADDLGSIMLEENVVRAAGTSYSMSIQKMVQMIRDAGRLPAQRNTKYEILRTFPEQ